MYNIINNLYLGNRLDSIDFSNQFDVVINCTYDLPFYIYDLSINTIRIPIKNDSNLSAELLYNYFDFIVKLIFDSLNNNKKILIYCKFGEQRSVSIICAFLIWTNNWSVEYTIGQLTVHYLLVFSIYFIIFIYLQNNKYIKIF